MIVDQLFRKLDEEQTRLACEALSSPQSRDAFEYGRACGLFAGLAHAKDVLVELLADREEKDKLL